ncbi:predicted protein [Naegleria gruberi]|uniref:Predicted protein n=1 Tax=Naegleria gruberi TaxID=5762 RepID=D2V722_NAEGR|nr:uncharacterized protein NAEGRDRAFT_64642 [Naegleria gruberi]EFC47184.1 predicted protein [Naegleria gruberi]|eukprot:XP_002679928.1 predicted protein [Naegleria gruberi strain NEG-M]
MPSSTTTTVENIIKVKTFAHALNQQDTDFAILFRHVYCLFNRTLCYSHDTVCPKGFFITDAVGKSINLFFVLDTPRLASEANLLIESSNHLLHGFVNIMVRITSQSFTSNSINNSCNMNIQHNNTNNNNSLRPSNDRVAIVPFIDEDHQQQDPSMKLFENSIFSTDISLKTFCEEYIRAVNNKAAVQHILGFFREISESIGSSDRFKIEIFKNCTCRSFVGDFYTVSRDILRYG